MNVKQIKCRQYYKPVFILAINIYCFVFAIILKTHIQINNSGNTNQITHANTNTNWATNCFEYSDWIWHLVNYSTNIDSFYTHKLLSNNDIIIFSLRIDSLNRGLCHSGLIHSIYVQPTQYIVNQQKYNRFNCSQAAGFSKKCDIQDNLWAYQYISQNYPNHKYVLFLEDDISFCPYIFKLIYDLSLHSDFNTNSMNLIWLGQGKTGLMIRIAYLSEIINYFKTNYNISLHNYQPTDQIDVETMFLQTNDINTSHITAQNFIFHPNSVHSKSLSQHHYRRNALCYQTQFKHPTHRVITVNDNIKPLLNYDVSMFEFNSFYKKQRNKIRARNPDTYHIQWYKQHSSYKPNLKRLLHNEIVENNTLRMVQLDKRIFGYPVNISLYTYSNLFDTSSVFEYMRGILRIEYYGSGLCGRHRKTPCPLFIDLNAHYGFYCFVMSELGFNFIAFAEYNFYNIVKLNFKNNRMNTKID
eukprot:556191_1